MRRYAVQCSAVPALGERAASQLPGEVCVGVRDRVSGGTSNLNNNALASYIAALLFQDAVTKAVANGGTLSRQTLTAALNNEHSFSAQAIIGPTDVAARIPSNCDVIMAVVNGAFQRVYPAKPGTFDCNPGNVGTIKMNENG